MSSGTGNDVLGRGLRVLGKAIRAEPRLFVVSSLGSSLFGLLIVANSYVVGFLIGHVVAPAFAAHRVDTAGLALAVVALLAISGLRVASIFARRLGAGFMQFRLQARYRRAVTRRYLSLPPEWHQRHATGSLLSNASSDVEAAFAPIAPLPFAVGTIVMLAVAMIALFVTDWVLAMVGVALFPALFALNFFYSRRMSPRQIHAQRMRAKVATVAHESFDGALVVKTMGREADESRRFAVFVTELRDALVAVGRLRGVFDPLMESLPSVGTLAVLVLGTWRLQNGAVTVSEVISVAFLFTVLAFPVRAIGWVIGELPRSVAGWDRVQAVLSAEGDLRYGEGELPGDGPAELRFDRVGYRYADGPPVLSEVSFAVPAGRTVALVGATGSGKSTIAALALRLVDPESGSVSLDRVKLPDLSAAALAGAGALVPQIPFVFDDTIRGNVSLDRPGIGDDEVWAALRLAQAEGFTGGLPERLDTAVGERGTSLSGGQRQRLTLARALAGRPRLLVLDDATSAVDPRVEAAILGALRAAGTSLLVVAYRRASIALADEVVYLHQGRVVATGTHQELMATQEGYRELVTAYEKADK
ncbi:multidrug ABC transporter ATP-binding protein [Actinoplanes lobatus]|uniref:ABC-type multidrug transport system fused ATPase/permease subunit n=2 Tax=Actinoplanes lobatus TaxID=113568 RepID=A0A7W7MH10_9ACTN|nr:ABC transporter ATP-binding protein [Actinoplanes lobatus]MBB4749505.1 ABC-type multidrug transport system fused ATPase/permease subunit [Actinoplanes lobatus]GGN77700.1 multidrug ABC transporter ATP-binding protein [Actinoplanes lobatus]